MMIPVMLDTFKSVHIWIKYIDMLFAYVDKKYMLHMLISFNSLTLWIGHYFILIMEILRK